MRSAPARAWFVRVIPSPRFHRRCSPTMPTGLFDGRSRMPRQASAPSPKVDATPRRRRSTQRVPPTCKVGLCAAYRCMYVFTQPCLSKCTDGRSQTMECPPAMYVWLCTYGCAHTLHPCIPAPRGWSAAALLRPPFDTFDTRLRPCLPPTPSTHAFDARLRHAPSARPFNTHPFTARRSCLGSLVHTRTHARTHTRR